MTAFFNYTIFGISISIISFMVGIIGNSLLKKSIHYNKFANLNFIQKKRINNMIGVWIVKWMVINTPLKYLNQNLKLSKSIEIDTLLKLRKDMLEAEISHLIGFIFVFIFSVKAWLKNEWELGLIILAINVLLNLHPVLLQQQNKRRIDRIIDIINS